MLKVKENTMYTITCPYCFKIFDDSEVKFRSEFVNTEELENIEIENERREAELFSFKRQGSNLYREWWTVRDRFNTSEPDDDARDFFHPYQRPIIDPSNPEWQEYLIQVGEGDTNKEKYLIRDKDDMAVGIKLKATSFHYEITCCRRVCPHCNNPIPQGFGKSPVITIPIVGTSSTGKTV